MAIGANVMLDGVNPLPMYGLSNCARGTIVDIIYDKDKKPP